MPEEDWVFLPVELEPSLPACMSGKHDWVIADRDTIVIETNQQALPAPYQCKNCFLIYTPIATWQEKTS